VARTAKPTAQEAPPAPRELFPARQVDLRKAVRIGLASGAAAVFISAAGILEKFSEENVVGGIAVGYLFLVGVPLALGYVAAKPPPRIEGFEEARAGIRNLAAGAITGVLTGLMLGLFLFVASSINIRPVFTNVRPALVELLTIGGSVPMAMFLMALAGAGVGLLPGAVHFIPEVWRRPLFGAVLWVLAFGLLEDLAETIFENTGAVYLDDFLYQRGGGLSPVGGAVVFAVFFALYTTLRRHPLSVGAFVNGLPENRRRPARLAIGALAVLVLLMLPLILERNYSHILNVAGIFLLMALGLNIVVGLAGLLDLGYVAFFAVGAYTTAVLTSPGSPAFAPELTFWAALPAVLLAAAVAGILVGTPVLRMRGDYLAIVTLGFGEITRLVVGSDWAAPVFGAARGVRQIPDITVPVINIEIVDPQQLFYIILIFLALTIYVSYALQDSRIGRAWMAIREDETVAEAMGVNVVAAKLWAFIIGAVFASIGGALFATQIGSVFPHTFKVLVSITVLVVIITGGLASVPGVILGSLVLVGLPEILRQFEEYRYLIYGALLIFMMLKRPEGFIPSRRRMQELHEEEVGQDAWLRVQQERQTEPEAG
jgi:branched-chain amino acid transport system permease protein